MTLSRGVHPPTAMTQPFFLPASSPPLMEIRGYNPRKKIFWELKMFVDEFKSILDIKINPLCA